MKARIQSFFNHPTVRTAVTAGKTVGGFALASFAGASGILGAVATVAGASIVTGAAKVFSAHASGTPSEAFAQADAIGSTAIAAESITHMAGTSVRAMVFSGAKKIAGTTFGTLVTAGALVTGAAATAFATKKLSKKMTAGVTGMSAAIGSAEALQTGAIASTAIGTVIGAGALNTPKIKDSAIGIAAAATGVAKAVIGTASFIPENLFIMKDGGTLPLEVTTPTRVVLGAVAIVGAIGGGILTAKEKATWAAQKIIDTTTAAAMELRKTGAISAIIAEVVDKHDENGLGKTAAIAAGALVGVKAAIELGETAGATAARATISVAQRVRDYVRPNASKKFLEELIAERRAAGAFVEDAAAERDAPAHPAPSRHSELRQRRAPGNAKQHSERVIAGREVSLGAQLGIS